ncbi:MAG: c-type cytochrome [Saprospiraceae bacterium]|nr:c-type cytochrome [Saprospiraceae bacterium]
MLRLLLGGLFIAFLLFAFVPTGQKLTSDQSVAKLLEVYGDIPLPHKPNMTVTGVSVERGKDIVTQGMSQTGGKKSRQQSKHFTCISCHNIKREDPDLTNPTPETRLKYVSEHEMPFLQGSPLYGIVNRRSFYNGDYVKKYGDLVNPTRHNLREAIQLCATECSQGRKLKEFELESILAYLWTIDLKLADLALTEDEMAQLQHAFNTGEKRGEAIKILRSKYIDYSPATFVDPPADRKTGDGIKGDISNGALVYKYSCQYCHFDNRNSFLLLDNTRLTFQHLLHKAGTYDPHSIYQVIRYGTPPKGGKEAYMPQYTKEKMSDQQMADLRAYVESEAHK